jgi:hypothetical protein
MAKLARVKMDDPDDEAWHKTARSRWGSATDLANVLGGHALEYYDPVRLPDFGASRSPAVQRELLGRFVLDRDTHVIHDCYAAAPECGVDSIANGTFYHFWSEVLLHSDARDEPCSACIGE